MKPTLAGLMFAMIVCVVADDARGGTLDTYTLLPQSISEIDAVQLRVDSDGCLVLDPEAVVRREGNVVHVELEQDDQCLPGLGHQVRTHALGTFAPGNYVVSIDHCPGFGFPPPGQPACQPVATIEFSVGSFEGARHRIPAGSPASALMAVACTLLLGWLALRRR